MSPRLTAVGFMIYLCHHKQHEHAGGGNGNVSMPNVLLRKPRGAQRLQINRTQVRSPDRIGSDISHRRASSEHSEQGHQSKVIFLMEGQLLVKSDLLK